MTICLNMIVRNEAPRILRALASVAPRIYEAAILDTGSTDGTQDLIRKFCEENDIHLAMAESPFKDFSTSRNEALMLAKSSTADYILLMDADMELRGDWPPTLRAPCYAMLQRTPNGGLSYWNTRLILRKADAIYRGVTHEYLDPGPGAGPPVQLHGPWFLDHADGGNRPGKFDRDIALLRSALDADPTDTRSCFYLAQSYRDAGDKELAKLYYARRVQMGGWIEEAFRAKLELGRLEDSDAILWEAFSMRPTRAEPLLDIARRANERRQHAVACAAASWGMTIPKPADLLFVEDSAYEWAMRQEFSIGANYHPDPRVKDLGRTICDGLSLDRKVPEGPRQLAFANYHFYIQPAEAIFPSWSTRPLEGFTLPEGLSPMAPSLCQHAGSLWTTIRAVNYDAGETVTWFTPRDGKVIRTRNYLLELGAKRGYEDWSGPLVQLEILLPEDWPDPQCTTVRGIEDLRMVSDGKNLWVSGNTREFTPQPGQPHGWCQMIEARLDIRGDHARMVDWRIISAVPPVRHEKNWMPISSEANRYLYLCDPTIISGAGNPQLYTSTPPIHAERFRGSSQLILWDFGWLGIIHEVEWRQSASFYRSRFVRLDGDFRLTHTSRPFYFHHHGLEIAMGLAHGHQENVLVGYSFKEKSPWIGTISADDIDAALGDPL